MNDSALKSFCTWARTELIKGVEAQMVRYGITEPAPAPVGSETVNGLPLSPAEIEQRDELLRMQAEVGHEALRDRAAYTWFNRIVAIRFMDACGWLPSRMRMLSRADGSHGSEAVENALDVEITTADTDRIAELKMAGLDEPLWRYLFVAQCEELADCLPGVFERVGGAMELLLPQGLMKADSVVGKLNAVLTDEDWREGVTVLGWMYQYYNADVKVQAQGSGGGHRARHAALHPRVDRALYGPELARPSVDAQQSGEFATRANGVLHRARC